MPLILILLQRKIYVRLIGMTVNVQPTLSHHRAFSRTAYRQCLIHIYQS